MFWGVGYPADYTWWCSKVSRLLCLKNSSETPWSAALYADYLQTAEKNCIISVSQCQTINSILWYYYMVKILTLSKYDNTHNTNSRYNNISKCRVGFDVFLHFVFDSLSENISVGN